MKTYIPKRDLIDTVTALTGSPYFSRDTMKFFNSRVYEGVLYSDDDGDVYKIVVLESVKPPHGARYYQVVTFTPRENERMPWSADHEGQTYRTLKTARKHFHEEAGI